jgi:hypothetical protein
MVVWWLQEAFEQRMKEINMGKAEFQSYERFRNAVQQHSNQLRLIMEEMTTRAKVGAPPQFLARHHIHGAIMSPYESNHVDVITCGCGCA